MEKIALNQYRQIAFDRLENLLLDHPPDPIDQLIARSIRSLSGSPLAPAGASPYEGLYGAGKTLGQYRDLAVSRLRDLAIEKLSGVDPIDLIVDATIRDLSNLPKRSDGVDPYARLFILRSPVLAIPEMSGKPDVTTCPTRVTADQIMAIASRAGATVLGDRIKLLTPGLNETLEKFNINTELRATHFLAQILHESGAFRWLREIWGPTDWQVGYEGRRDLGNDQAGDGKRFMGRGPIQLTGRANYTSFQKDVGQSLGLDFIAHPELAENPKYCLLTAGWYWNSRNLNDVADRDDVRRVTRIVNGGYNGLIERKNYLAIAKQIIHI